MYAIKVNNVSKIYRLYEKPIDRLKETLLKNRKNYHKDFFALNNVSFEMEKGETVGIIGTNGSGKSTILKIITGVLTPTEGNVEIRGKISALLELGAGFNMDFTGIENIYLNGTMMGFSKKDMDKKLNDILEFADIGDFIYQPVKTYSSGMFVRLAFALAINVEPEILIVDEALSVGDVFFQSKCFRKIDEIRKQGVTVLMVTHDMGTVIKYCDKVILLNKGQFIAQGQAGDMVDLYKKILANQFEENSVENNALVDTELIEKTHEELDCWKEHLAINPSMLEYGSKEAEIIDFGVFDHNGDLTNIITKGEEFSVKFKVKFHINIKEPIFAYTIKDKKGTEITGTNTLIEDCDTINTQSGQCYQISFTQEANMQGGEYLLSFGCTGYKRDDLNVYHRIYDATYLTLLSDKNTIGYFDINSKTAIHMIGKE